MASRERSKVPSAAFPWCVAGDSFSPLACGRPGAEPIGARSRALAVGTYRYSLGARASAVRRRSAVSLVHLRPRVVPRLLFGARGRRRVLRRGIHFHAIGVSLFFKSLRSSEIRGGSRLEWVEREMHVMNGWKVRVLSILGLNLLTLRLRAAQGPTPGDEAAACAGCGMCGAFAGVMILVPIAIFALNIALLIWVARDAKARGMDSSVLWMVLVLLTGPIGLLIYVFSRPQGNVVPCSHCANRRLEASARCLHCGNS